MSFGCRTTNPETRISERSADNQSTTEEKSVDLNNNHINRQKQFVQRQGAKQNITSSKRSTTELKENQEEDIDHQVTESHHSLRLKKWMIGVTHKKRKKQQKPRK